VAEWESPPAQLPSCRIFGGKAFSKPTGVWKNFPDSIFFQPQLEIAQPIKSAPSPLLPLSILSRTDLPNFEEFEKLVSNFTQLELDKLVLARQTTFTLASAPSPFQLLSQLFAQNNTLFAIQFTKDCAFIGATPEKLYTRRGSHIYSEAIAGTNPGLGALLQSEKDVREFQYVEDYIEKALAPLCYHIVKEKRKPLQTGRVHHLHTAFNGYLKEETTDAHLLEALHPTPAVNGIPKEKAFATLQQLEPFSRGWYASALGYISREKADFAVAIRSALLEGTALHLFAGGGLVDGSTPEAEWEEREQKIAPFTQLLSD
jgi:menaquinone-specific isochorismate synthase